ncbi:MAG: phosphoglucosamine mutase [Betaproteobacteria bacterium RIFCSPLOWO2_12_FULL_65_14]|nr:MAG: phosphoglucosamine mutase [Betaproteobacteria bacterium RIFCSPLOWO2_12_FULL_65_14]
MTRRYFGTDGVRGTVGSSPMTPDFVLRLGYAAGKVLSGAGRDPSVLIGKDTRISGYMIESALEAGFSAAGVDVHMCGPIPTPAVAYLTRALRLSAGVVISASHNAYPDNGIKIFSGDGFKLPDEIEARIEAEIEQPMGCNEASKLGRVWRVDDAGGRYIEFCKSTFPAQLDLKGLRIVVDCAHGAAYNVAPHVFHELGAEVVAMGVEPDGMNINEKCGATSPEAIKREVLERKADFGVALDGDGDRLLLVDAAGRSYDGDQLLYVIAGHRARKLERNGGKPSGVAGTLMTNLAFEKAMARLGIAFGRAKVGDRYVLELMREKGWELGGENSGHLICLDKHTTGDAIVSALQVLHAVRESGRSLAELTADLVMYPQVLVNVKVPRGFKWEKHEVIRKAQTDAERSLNGRGRVLLRPSGTEPVLRVMVEGEPRDAIESAANSIASAVRRAAAG